MFYARWKPATDIFHAGDHWLVRMEVAGVVPVDIELQVRGNLLTVRGRRRDLILQRDFICHTLEISYSDFERSLSFPARIVPASVRTEHRDGILHIRLDTEPQVSQSWQAS